MKTFFKIGCKIVKSNMLFYFMNSNSFEINNFYSIMSENLISFLLSILLNCLILTPGIFSISVLVFSSCMRLIVFQHLTLV